MEEWKDLSPQALADRLGKTGFFRRVDAFREEGGWVVAATEYPQIRGLDVRGSTLYSREGLQESLGLVLGANYNRISIQKKVERFISLNVEKGYTHLSVERISIDNEGMVQVEINEGVLARIEVVGAAISQAVLRSIFHSCIGFPYNVYDVKLALESMLYTGAFHSVHSEVIRLDGRVLLKIRAERKRLSSMSLSASYSRATGGGADASFTRVAKSAGLGFVEGRFTFASSFAYTLGQVFIDAYDYRRSLQRSHFSLSVESGWFHLAALSSTSFHLFVTPAFTLPLAKALSLAIFLRAGRGAEWENEKNRWVTGWGMQLAFFRRGPLDRWIIEARGKAEGALDLSYRRMEVNAYLLRKWPSGWDMQATGYWNRWHGVGYPRIFPDIKQRGDFLLLPEMILWPELWMVHGEIKTPYLGRFVRLGGFTQGVGGRQSITAFGLKAIAAIYGIPVHFRVFWLCGRMQLLAKTDFSFAD